MEAAPLPTDGMKTPPGSHVAGGGSLIRRSNAGDPAKTPRPQSQPAHLEDILARLPPGFHLVRADPTLDKILSAFPDTVVQRAADRLLAPPPYSFAQYCTDKFLEVARPEDNVLRESTYLHYARLLRQMDALDENNEPQRTPDWYGHFLPFVQGHEKGTWACENHRQAYTWFGSYYGVERPNVWWAAKRLDNKEDTEAAIRAGKKKRRNRFLDPVRATDLVSVDARPFEHSLNRQTFRHIAFIGAYCGPRASEPWGLRLGDVRDYCDGFVHWWQEKDGTYRVVQPPEADPYTSARDPSLEHYLVHVRPRLDPDAQYGRESDPVFLLYDEKRKIGRPWQSANAFRKWMGDGINAVLGTGSPGAHTLRRLCATLRYRYGDTIEQVAAFLDDTPGAIQNSYIDWTWIRRVGVLPRQKGEQRAALPRIMKGQRFGVPESPSGNALARRRQRTTRAGSRSPIRGAPVSEGPHPPTIPHECEWTLWDSHPFRHVLGGVERHRRVGTLRRVVSRNRRGRARRPQPRLSGVFLLPPKPLGGIVRRDPVLTRCRPFSARHDRSASPPTRAGPARVEAAADAEACQSATSTLPFPSFSEALA